MSRAAQHDILGLLPSVTLPLPSELINLAISLLAQSRSKASTLKQDEEIARGYACAHIACERLKQTLDLPAIVPRPPCPPRTYKKVFNYLNTALATTRQPESAPPPVAITPKKSRAAAQKATPKKTAPSTTRTPKSTAKPPDAAPGDEPEWLMTVIRNLCKALRTPAASPHVFTGVSSILNAIKERSNSTGTPSRKRARRLSSEAASETAAPASSFEQKQIPALIAVVVMYTISALTKPPTAKEYITLRSTIVTTLLKTVPNPEVDKTELTDLIEIFMREAQNGWLEMEWYQNIQPISGSEDEDIDGDEEAAEEEEEEEEGGPVASAASRSREKRKVNHLDSLAAPKRAFGTMMTDATDWLSDDRRAAYSQWKARIIKKIEQMEREN